MKRIDWLLFLVSRRTMMLVSILFFLFGSLMLISAFSGLPKVFHDGTLFLTVRDFQKEIPVDGHMWVNYPDSSIAVEAKTGRRVVNFQTQFALFEEDKKDLELSNVYKDTIRTTISEGKPGWKVKRLDVRSGVFYVEPSGLAQRLLLGTTGILICFVTGFCLWQLSKILKALASRDFFAEHIHRRIVMIGWAIIAFQLISILIHIINYPFRSVRLEVSSSIPNYRTPYDIAGLPATDFSFTWLIVGAMILLFARAFKQGQVLQKDRDLQI